MRVVAPNIVDCSCEFWMRSPRPVRSRTHSPTSSASRLTAAPFQSIEGVPRENSGGPPGWPLRLVAPPAACENHSLLVMPTIGPTGPKAELCR